MRDVHSLPGKKKYVEEFEEANTAVLAVWPAAKREGSVGAWHWHVDGKVVGEAWVHARKAGWWFRIAADDRAGS